MFCGFCGKEVQDSAVVCLSCGCEPVSGHGYCIKCGSEVKPEQVVCLQCGSGLKRAGGNKKSSVSGNAESSDKYSSFYCSSDDKVFLGLCGGLAHKYGKSTGMVRFFVFIITMFVAWIPYLVGLVLPSLPTKRIP
jgi:phage shock protein PspC (stress-responsive transcriptional regulator)